MGISEKAMEIRLVSLALVVLAGVELAADTGVVPLDVSNEIAEIKHEGMQQPQLGAAPAAKKAAAPKKAKVTGGMSKLLKSKHTIPTGKAAKKTFLQGFKLTTFASSDCSGKATATRNFNQCHKAVNLKECPKSIWTHAFTCKKTEKKKDMIYSEKWDWAVYNNKFVMRYRDSVNTWKHVDFGKSTGKSTCFNWLNDIQYVLLLQKLNAPSCRHPQGMKASVDAYLHTGGSFALDVAPDNKA